ncbi:hypothetical protein AAVH_30671 [Aphelenchoides avenae]|nr:hypothetical protein AAVH_30671 [Aphelenchus avenae]
MTQKGTFASLPVRAQALIVQLYFDSRGPANFSAAPRYWDDANRLNYHHGLKTMSSLSAESYWFSLKGRNPTIDELLEKVFSAGEPLTILQVPYRTIQSFNVEAFSETVKYFLAAHHPLSMRVFTVACFCHLLEWPEALSGRVRPCPKCSDYRLTKDSGQELRFDCRPTAYEAFHFHNTVTGQWLSVGAHMGVPTNEGGYAEPPRHSIRRLRFWMDSALPCAFGGNPTHIGRPMLASMVLDTFGYLTRAELETGMLVCRQWQTVVDRHFKLLPLRHIVKATYLLYADKPIFEIRSKSAVANGMDPVIRVAFSGNESASANASLLLRNAYLEALKIRSSAPEAQSVISELLRKTISCGDLDVSEFSSYDEHIRGHAVDNVAWLVAKTHLRKVTLRIKMASFAQNCLRIFDVVARTRVKYLRVNVVSDIVA